ncbi:hypothetical protein SLEP1_g59932, partial [Rubroshorea leprosula]
SPGPAKPVLAHLTGPEVITGSVFKRGVTHMTGPDIHSRPAHEGRVKLDAKLVSITHTVFSIDSVLVPGKSVFCCWREMHKQSLMVDAWMREAQEALKLVEDVETRVKNKNPHPEQQREENLRLTEIARSKLFEVGVKIDRLESLLHNPPSKPIFAIAELMKIWNIGGR